MLTVTVTWVDGGTSVYRCQHATVSDGVLWLDYARHPLDYDRHPRRDEPARRIPLVNVKLWEVQE